MTEDNKFIETLTAVQEGQLEGKINTTAEAELSPFIKVKTSDVDNAFKSTYYTKPKQSKKKKELSPEEADRKKKARLSKNVNIDPMSNSVTITKGKLLISIDDYNSNSFSGLSLSTSKTLDRIRAEYTRTGKREIRLHISKFSNRGIKDRRKLKETISRDVSNLYHVSLAYNANPKNPNYLRLTRIIDNMNVDISETIEGKTFSLFHGDYLEIELSSGYAKFLDKNGISHIDERAFIIDNPNAYAIYLRILGNLDMNQGTIRGAVIPIHTLQDACPEIQSKEEMRAIGDRHFEKMTTRTIKALNDIEATITGFKYHMCDKDGNYLTEEKAKLLQEKGHEEEFSNSYMSVFVDHFPYNEKKMLKNRKELEMQPEEQPEGHAKKPKKQTKS